MSEWTASPLGTFLRDTRGGVGAVELALSAAMLISVAALSFDLYSRMKAATASARVAVGMADYVSRDTAPDGDQLADLARFLHAHEVGVPSTMVIVLSAFRQPPGDPLPAVELLWPGYAIPLGDATVAAELAQKCAKFDNGGNANLPETFVLPQRAVLVVAEVCVRLSREGSLTGKLVAGDIYRLFAIPARNTEQAPVAPTTPGQAMNTGMSRDAGRRDGASPAASGSASRRAAAAWVWT